MLIHFLSYRLLTNLKNQCEVFLNNDYVLANNVLDVLFKKAVDSTENIEINKTPQLSESELAWLTTLLEFSEKRRGVLTVVVTSLVKKL